MAKGQKENQTSPGSIPLVVKNGADGTRARIHRNGIRGTRASEEKDTVKEAQQLGASFVGVITINRNAPKGKAKEKV